MATKRISKTGTFKVNRDASANYSNEKHKPLVAREYKITTYSDGTFKVSPKTDAEPKKAAKRKTSTAPKGKRKASK